MSTIKMELTPGCPICGCGSMPSDWYLRTDQISWYGETFHLQRCSCGMIYSATRPEASRRLRLWDGAVGRQIIEQSLRRPHLFRYYEDLFAEVMEKYFRGVAIAPIGDEVPDPLRLFDCGTGCAAWLKVFKDYGLEVAGSDLNPSAEWFAQKFWEIDVRIKPTTEVHLADKVDLVSMMDYIEHTYTPRQDLEWALENLEPGGLLFLKTFYMDSPIHKREDDEFRMYAHEHFNYFTEEVLVELIKDVGFQELTVRKDDLIIYITGRKPR